MQQQFNVIIVGGGISGVSAAYHLCTNKNFNGRVAIVEARDRLGGRIHGTELSSTYVELGANWIHGSVGNPIYELALTNKLVDPLSHESQPSPEQFNSKGYQTSFVTNTGEHVAPYLLEETGATYHKLLEKCLDYHKIDPNRHGAIFKQYDNSLGKHLVADIEQYLRTEVADNIALRKAIFVTLLQLEACICGSHTIEDVSLSEIGTYEELTGGNSVINGGYGQLVSLLLQAAEKAVEEKNTLIPEQANSLELFLEHQVKQIRWNVDTNSVFVDCENGTSLSCNHLISTLPLGVLKDEARTMFEPSLPSCKLESIERLGFNVTDKIFLEYSLPLKPEFWNANTNELFFVWPEDENNASDSVTLKDKSPENWWKTIYSFQMITDRCIVGWLSGNEAELVESMDPVEVGKVITENIFHKALSDLFPYPDNVLTTNWKSDVYSKGSYTYIKSTSSLKDIETLSLPIYSDPGQDKPLMLFAGESCHTSFYSTTHGAFLTGRKAASYLVDPDHDSE
ncbi:Spermine oxidase [Halotydeus destructor]|nr:Spermine oxidase [Halotydeus destructor]